MTFVMKCRSPEVRCVPANFTMVVVAKGPVYCPARVIPELNLNTSRSLLYLQIQPPQRPLHRRAEARHLHPSSSPPH